MAQAGTIVGSLSLAIQVLHGCMKGYTTIKSALTMPDNYGYLLVQFEMEHDRLRNFSLAAGLFESDKDENVRNVLQGKEQILVLALKEIQNVLDAFATSPLPKGMPLTHDISLPVQAHGVESVSRSYQSLADWTLIKEESPRGVFRSLKWSISDEDNFIKLLSRLRKSNDFLHELLDEHQDRILKGMQQETNMQLVQVRNSIDELKALVKASQDSRCAASQSAQWQQQVLMELESLATFKALYSSLLEGSRSSSKSLSIPSSHVRLEHEGGLRPSYPKAKFDFGEIAAKTVWINWQDREAPAQDDEGASLDPIEELTILLMAPKPAEFCVLPCLGYCTLTLDHEERLGLVFENPPHISDYVAPQNLHELLRTYSKPPLTHRISLACKIARCLLYIHCVNWLHKSLRSENILILPSADSIGYDIRNPYLTGFDCSRRARSDEATTNAPRIGSMEAYRHPDTQMNGPRGPRSYYRKSFDIYSLGIILIEIAHWRSIASIMEIESSLERFPKATSEIQSRWLTSESSLQDCLRAEIGDRYADVVKFCIAGRDSFGIHVSDLETSAETSLIIQQGFNALVVDKLHQIVV